MIKAAMLVLLVVATTPCPAQGLPVIDVTNLAQLVQTVSQLKAQLAQLQALFQSMNGSRGMALLLNNPALTQDLPPAWQNVYAAIRNGGYAGLTGSAKTLRAAAIIADCHDQAGAAQAVCNLDLNKTAQDQAFASHAYQLAAGRIEQVAALGARIDQATDAKAIADLNARLAVEIAAIEAEQTKLFLFRMLADSQDHLIAQQKHELDIRRASATGATRNGLSPVSFP